MARMPKSSAQSKKLVWRISPQAPQGEWIDPDRLAAETPPRADEPPKLAEPEVSTGSWITSSFDLLHGTDIVETEDASDSGLFDDLAAAGEPKPDRAPS